MDNLNVINNEDKLQRIKELLDYPIYKEDTGEEVSNAELIELISMIIF